MQEVTKEVVQTRMEGIAFMRRTGVYADEVSRGYGRAVMPLSGNENHVGSMYIGALSVLDLGGVTVATASATITVLERRDR